MKLSARNILKGTVERIEEGAVNGIVHLDVNKEKISATISMNAIRELGLAKGKEAYAVIKATEVMVSTEKHLKISARNQMCGKVSAIEDGAVNGIVKIDTDCGAVVSATISMNAIHELGLQIGCDATAVIKATTVMIGVD